MATINLQSATIINSGATLRLVFDGASWGNPVFDLSSVLIKHNRVDHSMYDGLDLYRPVVFDSFVVEFDTNQLTIDCHCTGNDGTTNSGRNPLNDQMSNITVSFDAGIATEGADSTAAAVDQVVTPSSVAAGPVYESLVATTPATRLYDTTELATGAISGLAIMSSETDVPRPGKITAAVDFDTLTVPGIDDPYMSGHFEWALTDTAGNPITAYSVDAMDDPVHGGTITPNTDMRGGELTIVVYEQQTVRLTLTAAYKTASGEVTATATQDYTVREIEWDHDVFIDPDNGDSANDGLDPHGFALTAGTYNPATRVLTSVGSFASYDHAAATAPTEWWKKYNLIYISGSDFEMPGTPTDWLKNQELVDAGTGTDAMDGWVNSGSGGDWTGNGIDIENFSSAGSIVSSQSSPTITRPSNINATDGLTIAIAYISGSGNSEAILDIPGVMEIRQLSTGGALRVIVDHSGGSDDYSGGELGGQNGRKHAIIRYDAGSLKAWIQGELVIDVTTTQATLEADVGTIVATLGGNHRWAEVLIWDEALSDDDVDSVAGYFAWLFPAATTDSSWNSSLVSGHPYESAPPGGTGLLEIESKIDNNSIVLAAGQGFTGLAGITSSSGPKDDGDSSLTGNVRARIKGGCANSCLTVPGNIQDVVDRATHAYGDGRVVMGSWGNNQVIGSQISGSGLEIREHGFIADIDGVYLQPSFRSSGNTGDGSEMAGQTFHNCRFTTHGDDNLAQWDNPNANNTVGGGNSLLKTLLDASGSLETNHVFTSDGATDGSGVSIAAPFGSGAVGTHMANNCTDDVRDHHIYPSGFKEHALFALMRFGEFGAGNYNINTNSSGPAGTYNEGITFWRNELANAQRGIDLSNTSNDETQSLFKSVSILECSAHDISEQLMLWYSCESVRIAHMKAWRIREAVIRSDDANSSIVLHDNRFIKESATSGAVVALSTAWGSVDTPYFRWKDDQIQDDRTQPRVFKCHFSNFALAVAAGDVSIDNVQVYAPNDTSSGAYVYDTETSTYKTVAQFESEVGLTDTFVDSPDFGWTGGRPEGAAAPSTPRTRMRSAERAR